MFCPSCGVEYTQKLNYCKRCGAGLMLPGTPLEPASHRPRYGWMFWAIAALGLGGLGIAIGVLAVMASFGIRGDQLVMSFFFSLAFIFGIALLLVRQLSRVTSAYQQAIQAGNFERPAEYQPAQIAAPPGSASSVVEHTTRQFAHPAYKEPSPRE